jgi:hypothetical protein
MRTHNFLKRAKRTKAQSSLEFVLLVSFVLLIMGIFLIVVQKNLVTVQQEKEELMVGRILRIVNSELVMAEQSGPGFKRTFFIPTNLDGMEYNISAVTDSGGNQDINISINGKDYIFFMSSESSFILNPEELSTGTHTIKRECALLRCYVVLDS